MKRRRITLLIFFALSQSMGEISCTPLVFSYCQFQRQRVREKMPIYLLCRFWCYCGMLLSFGCFFSLLFFFLTHPTFQQPNNFSARLSVQLAIANRWNTFNELINKPTCKTLHLHLYVAFPLFVFSHKSTQHEKWLSFI